MAFVGVRQFPPHAQSVRNLIASLWRGYLAHAEFVEDCPLAEQILREHRLGVFEACLLLGASVDDINAGRRMAENSRDEKGPEAKKKQIRRECFAEVAKLLRKKAIAANDTIDASLLLTVAMEIEAME